MPTSGAPSAASAPTGAPSGLSQGRVGTAQAEREEGMSRERTTDERHEAKVAREARMRADLAHERRRIEAADLRERREVRS